MDRQPAHVIGLIRKFVCLGSSTVYSNIRLVWKLARSLPVFPNSIHVELMAARTGKPRSSKLMDVARSQP